ncbi:MAG: class I SAM-dependent methyltransferase [Deltaproteobacteria bacterium]|nr:class I SAM-dependent methyltransferase [Deltaproteobacteria bacterium]
MRALSLQWLQASAPLKHLYQHRWLGERFYHLPGDMIALQEVLWAARPRLVIHTGIAAGGGPLFLASVLSLLGGDGRVVAVDPKPREEGLDALRKHPLAAMVDVLVANPAEESTRDLLAQRARDHGPVVVVLDLIHTHAHVLRELELLGELVTVGSYVVVLDTVMEDLPEDFFAGRPYGKGNNPGTAVRDFLARDARFEQDPQFEDRVLLTLAPGGFLRRAR